MKKKLLTIFLTMLMVSLSLPVTIFAAVHDNTSQYFTNDFFDWKGLKVTTDDTGALTGVSASAWYNYDTASAISGRNIGFYIVETTKDKVATRKVEGKIIASLDVTTFDSLMSDDDGNIIGNKIDMGSAGSDREWINFSLTGKDCSTMSRESDYNIWIWTRSGSSNTNTYESKMGTMTAITINRYVKYGDVSYDYSLDSTILSMNIIGQPLSSVWQSYAGGTLNTSLSNEEATTSNNIEYNLYFDFANDPRPAAPILKVHEPTDDANNDGIIEILDCEDANDKMQYLSSDGTWKNVPKNDQTNNTDTIINLSPGTYPVRRRATEDTPAGKVTEAVVNIHDHSFIYASDGNKITATCDGIEGGHTTTLQLNASNAFYTGSPYNGASIRDWNISDSIYVSYNDLITPETIYYVGRDGTNYDESTTAPTDIGKYTAKITLKNVPIERESSTSGDVTASIDFEINYNQNTEFNIIYKLNGGTNNINNPKSYTIGTDTITLANPSKEGYTFSGWTTTGVTSPTKGLTIDKGSIGEKTFVADWSPNTNTPYKVEHYKQKIDGTYPSEATYIDNLIGTTASEVTPAVKTTISGDFYGFSVPSTQTVTISADGTTLVKYEYTRNSYNVTFNANNHGSQPNFQSIKYEGKVTKPDSDGLSQDGYTFGGWYKDENCTQAWNFDVDTVKKDMTLYAKWIADSIDSATISGNVKEGAENVENAIVELYLGTTKIAATTTDSNGEYFFDKVENGTYNIVVTKPDGKTKTVLVTMNDNPVNVVLPNSSVNSKIEHIGEEVVNTKTDIKQAVVGGLDAIAADQNPGDGQTITIKLKVEPKQTVDSAEEIKRIAGSDKKVEFIDMSLIKLVNDVVDDNDDIGDTNTKILTIIVPFDFTNIDVNSVAVLRKHGDEDTETLTKNPTSGTEGYVVNKNAGTITIYAKKFSDYAIAYANTSSSPSDPTPKYIVPKTGVEETNSNNHSLLKLSSLSLLALGSYMIIKKKKDN